MQILDLSYLHSKTFLHQKLVILFQVYNSIGKGLLLSGTSHKDLIQNCYDTCYFLGNLVM